MDRPKMATRDLILCALFAALTALCSQIALPLQPVPLNLATLAVYLAGGVLGGMYGALSQVVYVLLGMAGVPVFSSLRGGLAVLAGPTGGYIAGYILSALVIGLLAARWGRWWQLAAAMLAGTAVCYALGTVWYMALSGASLASALGLCVLPFLPGDAVKIAVAVALTPRLKRGLARIRR